MSTEGTVYHIDEAITQLKDLIIGKIQDLCGGTKAIDKYCNEENEEAVIEIWNLACEAIEKIVKES